MRERETSKIMQLSALVSKVVKWGGLLQHNMACCCSSLMILMRKEERAISVNGVIWCKHSRDTYLHAMMMLQSVSGCITKIDTNTKAIFCVTKTNTHTLEAKSVVVKQTNTRRVRKQRERENEGHRRVCWYIYI